MLFRSVMDSMMESVLDLGEASGFDPCAICYSCKDRHCFKCKKKILSEEESNELADFIDADQEFDSGEFSGSHDYYKDVCVCELEF